MGGYHNRLRCKQREVGLDVYRLSFLLYREAELIPMLVEMIGQEKLEQAHRKKTKTLQSRLFNLWDMYNTRDMDTGELLTRCALLYDDFNSN